jgi:CheY-like chemotaxis protein
MMYSKRLDAVLIVEDNEDHMTYTQDALHEGNIARCIISLRDGQAALDYLFRENEYSNPLESPRPTLILLDLMLPKVNGLGILEKVKKDSELRRIPIILLTSSTDDNEIRKAAELGVNDCILKPIEYEVFIKKVIALGIYWARVSDLTY